MELKDFYFDLPQELIAQTPLADRSASKLLVLDKKTGAVKHSMFSKITQLINPGDCIVINDTKVIPARLMGTKKDSDGEVEFLLLKKLDEKRWETLVKPGKRAKTGDSIIFQQGVLEAVIEDITPSGNRVVKFEFEGIFEEVLDRIGEMPLPPYITEKLEDKSRYQTVYAKNEGSAAAPTAGLHFTEDILYALQEKQVSIAHLTLHVGLGTFRPVKVDNVLEHEMHKEYYSIDQSQADIINETKKRGGKVIAVGTTSCRTLESCVNEDGLVYAATGETGIFIYPGFEFKAIDALITNFHLPESTLVMLVSALAGRENILNAYKEAVEKEYRFFSFGDAMFIGDIKS